MKRLFYRRFMIVNDSFEKRIELRRFIIDSDSCTVTPRWHPIGCALYEYAVYLTSAHDAVQSFTRSVFRGSLEVHQVRLTARLLIWLSPTR